MTGTNKIYSDIRIEHSKAKSLTGQAEGMNLVPSAFLFLNAESPGNEIGKGFNISVQRRVSPGYEIQIKMIVTSPVRSSHRNNSTPISPRGQAVALYWHGGQVRPGVGAQAECFNSIQLIAPLIPTTAHYHITSEGCAVYFLGSIGSINDLVGHV